MQALKGLAGYAPELPTQGASPLQPGCVLDSLARRHGPVHDVRTDAALYDHVTQLRQASLDKAFYALCTHMEPDDHAPEFDVRLRLCGLELGPRKSASQTPLGMAASCA